MPTTQINSNYYEWHFVHTYAVRSQDTCLVLMIVELPSFVGLESARGRPVTSSSCPPSCKDLVWTAWLRRTSSHAASASALMVASIHKMSLFSLPRVHRVLVRESNIELFNACLRATGTRIPGIPGTNYDEEYVESSSLQLNWRMYLFLYVSSANYFALDIIFLVYFLPFLDETVHDDDAGCWMLLSCGITAGIKCATWNPRRAEDGGGAINK